MAQYVASLGYNLADPVVHQICRVQENDANEIAANTKNINNASTSELSHRWVSQHTARCPRNNTAVTMNGTNTAYATIAARGFIGAARVLLETSSEIITKPTVRFWARTCRSADGAATAGIAVVSTGQRNTVAKSLSRCLEVQRFSGPLVELTREPVELELGIRRQVGPSGKVLAQQPVGIFV